MTHNLPVPEIRFRMQLKYITPIEGEVVAYKSSNNVGVMLLDTPNWFIAATHFNNDPTYVWQFDEVPDGTEFYIAEQYECDWGYDEFIAYLFSPEYPYPDGDPILNYLSRNAKYVSHYHSKDVLFDIIKRIPYNVKDIKKYEPLIWNSGLRDIGVDFDRHKAELFCYFLSVVRIWENSKGNDQTYCYQLSQLDSLWEHLSWMFGMALGRVLGSEDKNFTSQINHLDSKKRSKYIHLYMALVESNIEKYPEYNNVEKKDNLKKAIRKIKLTGEREKQEHDLDELFKILFPHHFQRVMSENRPASSIAELKANYEQAMKDLDAARGKLKETVALYESQLQDMATQLAGLVSNAPDQDNTVSFSYVRQQLLMQDYRSAHDLSIKLNDLMTGYKGWSEFYLTLREEILAMKPSHTTNVTIQSGATYNDIHDNTNPTIQ